MSSSKMGWIRYSGYVAAIMVSAGVARADLVYSSGHGDLGIGVDTSIPAAPKLDLHWHFESNWQAEGMGTQGPGEFAPSEVIARARNTRIATAAEAGFLGIAPGQTFFFLPQTNAQASSLNAPFLGIGTEELAPTDNWSNLRLSLSSVSFTGTGPGVFALFQDAATPALFMSSSNPTSTTPANSLTLTPDAHDHFIWAFSGEGQFDVTVNAFGTRFTGSANQVNLTDTGTYRFYTGNFASVPEPTSATLIGFLAVGVIATRAFRRIT